ncbi:MAG: phage/plasmid primase, P4 family [Alphaproteobacteria bacterium]
MLDTPDYSGIREQLDHAPRWTPPEDKSAPPALSDDDLATRFTAKHGKNLRYVSDWGKWLEWDGQRWRIDKTLKVYDLARLICRAAASTADADDAADIASARTAAAVEKLAKADRQHAATVEIWDTDPWLLNTPGGVVDLKTGNLLPHRREFYQTKITAVAPGGDCPTWIAFLNRVTAGDRDLQGFLQRIMGYALTGVTRDHALFFAHGSGGNGKGVFLNTMTRLLGDYAAVAPMETFVATASDRHPTDIASLRGARLVTAQETEEGRRWAEAKIKSLTGGDPISARFMRQDHFTFTPQFKLVIAGNHKPSLRSVDEAMRRRFHLLPFTVTIPAGERDPSLPRKLEAEWGGILAWAIRGCLDWQRIGLAPPKAVIEATEKYLSEEDGFAGWLDECCEVASRHWETTATLFRSWNAWAERNGEQAWTAKRFNQVMEQRGFEPSKRAGARVYLGLQVRNEEM